MTKELLYKHLINLNNVKYIYNDHQHILFFNNNFIK